MGAKTKGIKQESNKLERDDVSFLHASNSKVKGRAEIMSWRCILFPALIIVMVGFCIFAYQGRIWHTTLEWPQQNAENFERGKHMLLSLQFDTLSFSSNDLCHLVLQIFYELDFPRTFGLKESRLKSFILTVRDTMRDIPYHNWFHVVDVTQVVFSLVHSTNLLGRLDKIQQFGIIVSALCHDLDHPGVNNQFLIASREELATLYNDISPLENHHSSLAFQLLQRADIGLLENMTTSEYQHFRKVVISNILATDMGRHSEYASKLGRVLTSAQKLKDVQFEMEVLLKYADISSVCRPFRVSQQWAMRVTNEFFQQGDEERKRGLAVTPSMDRRVASRVLVQQGFIDFVVTPFSQNMTLLLPPLRELGEQLALNRANWAKIDDSDLEAFCRRPDTWC
jgi:hypothetical protein